MNLAEFRDPMRLKDLLWPDVYFYDKQREVIKSVWEDDATYVPAGNMLGKDFTSGFICLAYFLTRRPCRIVTTSAKADHLRVLWGEIMQFIMSSRIPLTEDRGGPLVVNHQEIRWKHRGVQCPKSYIVGMVASKDSIASMQGHHVANIGDGVPRTLFVSDESSSVPDDYEKMANTWANRQLVFGNTWPCDNFFKRGVKAGTLMSEDGRRCYRRVIRIKATDHPNVRLGLAQKARGQVPTDEVLVPGKTYGEYEKNLATWDKVEQCVKLHAEFYEGSEVMMFPAEWLNRAEQIAVALRGQKRVAKAIGVDSAEGGDKTAWAAVDDFGLIELIAKRTPDTDIIPGETIAFGQRHGAPPENWVFDRGGGGKQHADKLRKQGFNVRTVAFGEAPSLELKRGMYPMADRKDMKEERYVYVNRRAELYGELRLDLKEGWAIPPEYQELRHQLSPIPLMYDGEGRMRLLPKHKKDPESTEKTLTELIGHSPDEADATVLANHGRRHKSKQSQVSAIGY